MTLTLFKGDHIVRVFRESQAVGKFMDILGFAYSGETLFMNVYFASEENNGAPQNVAYQLLTDFDRLSIE